MSGWQRFALAMLVQLTVQAPTVAALFALGVPTWLVWTIGTSLGTSAYWTVAVWNRL